MMVVGLGYISLRLHDCHSLKDKRKVIKSIKGRLRSHFNIAVAEVGLNDVYQQAAIGFAFVGNDRQMINAKIDKAFNFVDALGLAEVVDTQLEILNV
jgi:uncharacterized protein